MWSGTRPWHTSRRVGGEEEALMNVFVLEFEVLDLLRKKEGGKYKVFFPENGHVPPPDGATMGREFID